MDNKRQLTYGKISKELDLKPEIGEAPPEPVATSDVAAVPDVETKPIAGYQKTDGMLSYSIICVISGGTERERDFLAELVKKRSFRSLDVIFVSSGQKKGGLTPRMMDEAYRRMLDDGFLDALGRKVIFDEVDSVYMLTDVDHYEMELKELLLKPGFPGYVWIVSNPDFEIWLYYCFRNDPYNELQEVMDAIPSARSSLLKTVNGRFNNGGGLDPRKAFEHIRDGVAHSKAHYQKEGCIPSLLSTQMHILAEGILSRLGPEYDSHLNRVREFREKMRRR